MKVKNKIPRQRHWLMRKMSCMFLQQIATDRLSSVFVSKKLEIYDFRLYCITYDRKKLNQDFSQ